RGAVYSHSCPNSKQNQPRKLLIPSPTKSTALKRRQPPPPPPPSQSCVWFCWVGQVRESAAGNIIPGAGRVCVSTRHYHSRHSGLSEEQGPRCRETGGSGGHSRRFRSEHPPDVVRSQLSSCVALSAPGPHAFILCVPVDQPAQAELQALGALEKVFGPGAVRTHTLVLFTHSDRLKESGKVGVEGVEKYISSQRRDLLELVKRCGDRYHVMERGSGGEEEEERKRRSVGELLEKVEQT
uniref:AIG1-type G domain-containing protein n=1 Tax=Oncorhynchus kisutch TaxID=8019 RepID=A0A8C7GYR0_ONCKI